MHTLRRLALASALILTPALAGAARAGDVTYPQLQNQTTVIDTDLLAAWRNAGPLAKINASVLAAYLQAKFNAYYLQPSNNLSDLANAGTARTNLGLGTAATLANGTSGNVLCALNQNCTVSGAWTFNGGLVASGGANPGVDAATPNNGTTGGLRVRGNATSGFGYLQITDSAASIEWSHFQFSPDVGGVPATGPAAWVGGPFTFTNGVVGNASTASKWLTARTETLSGDVSGSASVDGSGNWTVSTTLATTGGGFTGGDASHTVSLNIDTKGRVLSASAVPITYPSQLPSMTGNGGALLTNNGSSASWAMRASLYATGCSSFGCTTNGSTNASLSRIGTGHYTITFANAFPNTNFSFVCLVGQSSTGNWFCQEDTGTGRSVSSVSFYVTNNNSTAQDNAGSLNVIVLAN